MTVTSNWSHYFAQLGENQAFEQATEQTQQAINRLFQESTTPYSGLDPVLLKQQINAVDFTTPSSLKEVITQTNDLIEIGRAHV